MTQKIIEALADYCQSPPDDLVAHFDSDQLPVEPSLSINFLPLSQALEYTNGIQQYAILGEPFGLIALEDANNSNPYCYVTKGPTQGCVMYLCHDGDSGIAFSSLNDFLAAIDKAMETGTDIEDLAHDDKLTALDRTSILEYVSQLVSNDGLTEELCIFVPLIPTSKVDLLTELAGHYDFFVREAVAIQIAKSPHVDLLAVAKRLSTDPHPQVARPGNRALSAIQRVVHNA